MAKSWVANIFNRNSQAPLLLIFFSISFRMPNQTGELVDPNFIAFLRATLGKMAGTNVLDMGVIDLDFWTAWPRRFYNIRTYDATRDEFDHLFNEDTESDLSCSLRSASSVALAVGTTAASDVPPCTRSIAPHSGSRDGPPSSACSGR